MTRRSRPLRTRPARTWRALLLTVAVLAAVPATAPPAAAAPPAPDGQATATPTATAPVSTPSATSSPDPRQSDRSDVGLKECLKNLAPWTKPEQKVDKLVECLQKGAQQVPAPPSPGDVASSAGEALLKPFAEGIAKTTNELVLITVTGWLQLPSIRITDSGVFVQPDRYRTGTKLPQGGCLQPIPNATLGPAPDATGVSRPSGTGSAADTGSDSAQGTGCGPSRAVSQFSSAKLQGVMVGVGTIVATLLLIFAAMRTAFTRKGHHVMEALQGLLVMAVMTAIGLTLLDGLLIASDALTEQILDSSLSRDLGERVSAMLGLSVAAFGPVPVILFGVVVFAIAVVQLVMLFIRQAAIPVLAMLMPVAAAGQVGGHISRQWLVRLWTSLLAIVAYKPLAALIFAVGFLETGEGRGFWDIVRGLTTLVLAILALPTLMKIFTPIVGQAVSIGAHNVTLASIVGGASEGGSLLGSLIKSHGGASGGDADAKVLPSDPQSYERVGALAGAGGVTGAAAGGAGLAAAVATAAARRVDEKVAQGADAFIGGDGAARTAPPGPAPADGEPAVAPPVQEPRVGRPAPHPADVADPPAGTDDFARPDPEPAAEDPPVTRPREIDVQQADRRMRDGEPEDEPR
ncbi:hypothetical protein Acsp04_63760 [Actinomadura sp. NBRC 104425]|uniref:hypothetical protein n=1 Tax=Actinomadura sp. NBRC 104425 TaxID=3032204 RepID=UPI00249FCA90|nr:hypothetical protein [Actinomadura sp. NBRC 104425]GLZ16141.1 hypothetical protein Acsp04_63760 [Actinomadura sp. NBRC 104425]